MNDSEKNLSKILIDKNLTVSIAESCTGGLISNRLTNLSGSSRYFKLGIVAYSNQAKQSMLKVPQSLIKHKGAVSGEVAIKMAVALRKISKTDIALGVTGIAGPTGATKNKPVGLVYIACSTKKKTICKKYQFRGNRLTIKRNASSSALKLLKVCSKGL